MGYLTTKYKGKYRLRCEIDKSTYDFPRTLKGSYEESDIYIDCMYGIKVYYYGHGILECYSPTLQRGRNIIRKLYAENINPNNVSISQDENKTFYKILDQETFKSDIQKSKFIFNIIETDSEVTFRFYEKNSELILPVLKPKTSGASISPFSSKNLPKAKYDISAEQMSEYESIIKPLKEDGKLLVLSQITQKYINSLSKKKQYKGIDMKIYMRKKMLKGKDFIHSEGYWDDYLSYLRKEIEDA